MAQKQIDESKKNKGPAGAVLVRTPYSGNERLVLCSATGVPLVGGYALDRAFNTVVVASPYIGALLLSNLKALSVSQSHVDRKLADTLLPRIEQRLFQNMWTRLTRNDNPRRMVIDESALSTQAASIKGKRGPYSKFIDALNTSLKDAPLSFSESYAAPILPIPYSLACGYSWAEIAPLLAELYERAEKFEKHWGWHCRDLKKGAKEIHSRRSERRMKKIYFVVQMDTMGKTILEETFDSLVEAHDRACEIKSKAQKPGSPWEVEISGHETTLVDKNGGRLTLPQEIRWRQGRCSLSLYRSPEKLVDLIREPGEACSSSDQSLSDD